MPLQETIFEAINSLGREALDTLRTLSAQQWQGVDNYAEIISDLGCLCRTLLALTQRFKAQHAFANEQIMQIVEILQNATFYLQRRKERFDINEITTMVSKSCFALNSHIARTLYILSDSGPHLIYPNGYIVKRDSDQDRYHMSKHCKQETVEECRIRFEKDLPIWTRLDGSHSVYEHIGRLDGGEDMYDPTFIPWTPEEARTFFTPGRVFSTLWTLKDEALDANVVHHDRSIEVGRSTMNAMEGVWTGPYRGPTTGRWFVVIGLATSSCFCLPIIKLPFSSQSTRDYLHISTTPASVTDTLQIDTQYTLPHIETKLDSRKLPPVSNLPPTNLPLAYSDIMQSGGSKNPSNTSKVMDGNKTLGQDQSLKTSMAGKFFVDGKRLVEVEFGLKIKNVGMLIDNEIRNIMIHRFQPYFNRSEI